MGSVLKCGYECGAPATVDFLWPNDAEVWHVCDAHASALQRMLDEQRGSEWAARVVRWPTQSANGQSGPRPNVSDDAMTSATDTTESMPWLGRRTWAFMWRIRSWFSQAR
jgi:hypothetical protein